MTLNLLDHFLLSQIFAFLLIFCRVGSVFMVVPGFSEAYVTPRMRLAIGLGLSLLLTPMLIKSLPPTPPAFGIMALMIISEILIGVFLGLIVRLMLSSMHVAGTSIAAQSSLALASVFDISNGGQSAIISNFLSLTAITCFFALNLHHILIAGMVDSYNVFQIGNLPIIGDMSMTLSRVATDAFMVGIQLSAPWLIFSLLFYLFGGLLTRIMPNFQIFFVLIPPQIMLALFLLLITLSSMMMYYMNHLEDQLLSMLGGL